MRTTGNLDGSADNSFALPPVTRTLENFFLQENEAVINGGGFTPLDVTLPKKNIVRLKPTASWIFCFCWAGQTSRWEFLPVKRTTKFRSVEIFTFVEIVAREFLDGISICRWLGWRNSILTATNGRTSPYSDFLKAFGISCSAQIIDLRLSSLIAPADYDGDKRAYYCLPPVWRNMIYSEFDRALSGCGSIPTPIFLPRLRLFCNN